MSDFSQGAEKSVNQLTSPSPPNFELVFILDTNTSAIGIDAVLSQVQDGTERVMAYSSRTLAELEQQYDVT